MLPYAKWTADYLYERICYESYSLFEHRVATPSLIRQLEDLFSPFEALRNMSSSAQYGVEFYEFYFRIPWKRQAKATKKRTKKWEWLCLCFRRDHYRGDVYYAIQIGHSIILDVFDGNGLRGKDGYETMAKCEWIKPLKDLVAILMSFHKRRNLCPFYSKASGLSPPKRENPLQRLLEPLSRRRQTAFREIQRRRRGCVPKAHRPRRHEPGESHPFSLVHRERVLPALPPRRLRVRPSNRRWAFVTGELPVAFGQTDAWLECHRRRIPPSVR